MDDESKEWVRDLRADSPIRDLGVGRLFDLMLGVARAEAARRRGRIPRDLLNELDDLCAQAASDAVMAVLQKLDTFRGDSRFTTWACKFVILELSSRLRRRIWRDRIVSADDGALTRIADSAPSALQSVEHRELISALHDAVSDQLTEHQQFVFRAAVMDGVPIDVVAERLQSSRGAVYKTLHDARRKLRRALSHAGHGESVAS